MPDLEFGDQNRFLQPAEAQGRSHFEVTIMETPADYLIFSDSDKAVLRTLAQRVAELAARPVEDEKRDLWYRHNALEPTRPVIFCDPENGWNEIITDSDLQCTSQLARSWERKLSRDIFWGEQMRDDRVITANFDVPFFASLTGWGLNAEYRSGGQGGSYTWDPPLKSYDDLGLLRFPVVDHDAVRSVQIMELAKSMFDGILTVRRKGGWWWTLGMTQIMISLRGLDRSMYDMIDCPDDLHRLMAFLRDGTMAMLDALEEQGLLSLNNDDCYVGSGGFGWTNELPQAGFDGHVRTRDMWGFAESQETVGVSPDMFAEFIFPYQLPLLERFGLNCYGCCEPVDTRWHVIKNIPRLRRVSVSPWSNIEKMAENLDADYIFSMKPNPADLAHPSFDEDRIRKGLKKAMRITKDCRVEVIMKDCHTIGNDPQRVIRWTRIAREEAETV